jgi:transcriptional regulator with XRE-family HTH domain
MGNLPALARLRAESNLTQEQLAARAGLTVATVNRVERGLQRAQAKTVLSLARVFDLPFAAMDALLYPPSEDDAA